MLAGLDSWHRYITLSQTVLLCSISQCSFWVFQQFLTSLCQKCSGFLWLQINLKKIMKGRIILVFSCYKSSFQQTIIIMFTLWNIIKLLMLHQKQGKFDLCFLKICHLGGCQFQSSIFSSFLVSIYYHKMFWKLLTNLYWYVWLQKY